MKSKGRVIGRFVLTFVLLILLYAFLTSMFEHATDDYRPDLSLTYYLDQGEYSRVAEYYDTVSYLYGTEDQELYGRYQEFTDFYFSYILYVESGDPQYIADMEQKMEHTAYQGNIPHYEYLLELAQNDEITK